MNALMFFEQMREAGVAQITAEYSGSGDEGYINDCIVYNAEGQDVAYGGEGGFPSRKGDPELIDDAINFINNAIYETVGGYQDNEGGGGSVVIDIGKGTAYFDHYYNVEEQVGEPFKICVNVDTGETAVETKHVEDELKVEASELILLRKQAACWRVMDAALNDVSRRVLSNTGAVAIGLGLQQEFVEGKGNDVHQDDQSRRADSSS